MYQITGTQKELYYKDFIKKPKNKFSSQWILQRAMANAITKRQSKSYHVNKNDMSFCTQKQQLKDWQQNFQMYNQQAEIFKGRKKTDVQIQIELLKEYCLQLSGKDIQSPQDITLDDIRCLNADIDLFYKQASLFDPQKEETSSLSSSQQIVSQFQSAINPQRLNLNPQVVVPSQKNVAFQQNTRASLKENKLIQEEEDLGLNTHNSQKITPSSQYNDPRQLNPFTMYDNQSYFNNTPIKTLNQQTNQHVQSTLQQQQMMQEQQKQIKHQIMNSETIQYINVNNHNTNMDANDKIEYSKSDDLHMYLSNNTNIQNNQIFEVQPNSYFTNRKSPQESMGQQNQIQQNKFNGIQFQTGYHQNQQNLLHQQQIQIQQANQMNIKIEQQNQAYPIQQRSYQSMVNTQQENRQNKSSSFNQEQNQYINIQQTQIQQQQIDSLYNIYNNQDNQISSRQLKSSQNPCKKEYQDDQGLTQSTYNHINQNILTQEPVNSVQFQQNNNHNIQYQYNQYHNQIIVDSELPYMNQNKNQIKDNNSQKNIIQQSMYDGHSQYLIHQKQFSNDAENQVKHEEVTETSKQYDDQQDDMNQENPQDGPNDDFINYNYNNQNNYHDMYMNQFQYNNQQLNQKNKEINQRNNCEIDQLQQQTAQINYYQLMHHTESVQENNSKLLQNQFDSTIEEEVQYCDDKPYNQMLQHQSSLNNQYNQYLSRNNSFGNDIQNIDMENIDNLNNYNELMWQSSKYSN